MLRAFRKEVSPLQRASPRRFHKKGDTSESKKTLEKRILAKVSVPIFARIDQATQNEEDRSIKMFPHFIGLKNKK